MLGKEKIASDIHRDDVSSFCEGDIVTSAESSIFSNFFGVVDRVEPKENKVYVVWGGGTVKQHDPSELVNHTALKQIDRRFKGASSRIAEEDIHGLKSPVSGGTDVMWNLVKKLRTEALSKAGLPLTSSEIKELKPRRAVYHREKGRIYQRSKNEKADAIVNCPNCKVPMEEHGLSRNVQLYVCPICSWKVTSDKLV